MVVLFLARVQFVHDFETQVEISILNNNGFLFLLQRLRLPAAESKIPPRLRCIYKQAMQDNKHKFIVLNRE